MSRTLVSSSLDQYLPDNDQRRIKARDLRQVLVELGDNIVVLSGSNTLSGSLDLKGNITLNGDIEVSGYIELQNVFTFDPIIQGALYFSGSFIKISSGTIEEIPVPVSPTPTVTPSISRSPSNSPIPASFSVTPSISRSPSNSPLPGTSFSVTPSISRSPSNSPIPASFSVTPSISRSPSPTPSPAVGPFSYTGHFQDASWEDDFYVSSGSTYASLVDSDPSLNFTPINGKALKIDIPAGSHYGSEVLFYFRDQGIPEPEEASFTYYLRLADDWDAPTSGKLPAFGGTYWTAGWGGRPATGEDGWSARGLFNATSGGQTQIGNYVYHVDQPTNFGENFNWDSKGLLNKNTWYKITQYLKLNTPGFYDGILRTWVDDQLSFEKTNFRFRDTGSLKIETVWLNTYLGGSTVSLADQHLYIDELFISVPGSTPAPSPTPTPTPTRTPSVTPTISRSPSRTPSITPTPTRTPTVTPTISNTPSRTPSITPTPTRTPTVTPTISNTPSNSPSPLPPSRTPTVTPSISRSPSNSPIPASPTPSATPGLGDYSYIVLPPSPTPACVRMAGKAEGGGTYQNCRGYGNLRTSDIQAGGSVNITAVSSSIDVDSWIPSTSADPPDGTPQQNCSFMFYLPAFTLPTSRMDVIRCDGTALGLVYSAFDNRWYNKGSSSSICGFDWYGSPVGPSNNNQDIRYSVWTNFSLLRDSVNGLVNCGDREFFTNLPSVPDNPEIKTVYMRYDTL